MTTSDPSTVTSGGIDRLSAGETRGMIRRAAAEMGGLVRTTMGPYGRDKLVVRRMGDGDLRGFTSNVGIAIVEEFEGETDGPIGEQFVRLAEAHEDDYGDGSTAAVVYASELLQTGMTLIDEGVPPSAVVEGFSIGGQRTLEVWEDIAIPLAGADRPTDPADFDVDRLESVARAAITNGAPSEWPLESLAAGVVEAATTAWEPDRGTVDLHYARTEAIPGGDGRTTETIPGILLPYDPMNGDELLAVEGPVLLVHGDLGSRSLRASSLSYDVADLEVAAGIGDGVDDIVDAIVDAGAAAVFVAGDVEHAVGEALAHHGVPCFRNVKRNHLEYVARVTGSEIRSTVGPRTPPAPDHLGSGSIALLDAQGEKTWLEVTAPDGDTRCVSVIAHGGTQKSAEETERRIRNGLNAVRAAIKRPTALPGGGAAELAAAASVRSLAPRFDGREQLAIEAFADVLEVVPATLATNAGHDPIDALTTLRSAHAEGADRAGVDAEGRLSEDVVEASDALDASLTRTSALVRAIEFTNSLCRVDSVLLDRRLPFDPDEIPGPDP